MAFERDALNVLDCVTRDDLENKQIAHELGAVSDNEVPAPIPSPTDALPDLQIDLIAHSIYRRPPPIRL
jgi:hypothetical protein